MTTQSGVDVVKQIDRWFEVVGDNTNVSTAIMKGARAEIIALRSRVAEAEGRGIEHRKAFITLAKVLATAAPDDFIALSLANKMCRDLGITAEEVDLTPSAGSEKEAIRALSAFAFAKPSPSSRL